MTGLEILAALLVGGLAICSGLVWRFALAATGGWRDVWPVVQAVGSIRFLVEGALIGLLVNLVFTSTVMAVLAARPTVWLWLASIAVCTVVPLAMIRLRSRGPDRS